VKGIGSLLRAFSYVFHALFILVTLVMAGVLLASGKQSVNFDLLPLTGRPLAYGLAALALVGVVSLLLAVRRKAQMLYVVWSVFVLALVVRFLFFSTHGYTPGSGDFNTAIYAVAAAILAALGARQKPGLNSR
jgi:hypothetical protein